MANDPVHYINQHQEQLEDFNDEVSDGASILGKMKKRHTEGLKRPDFMQIVKLDSGLSEIDRSQLIMTPHQQASNATNAMHTSELNQSKGDLSNNSHYYRFKKHSLGY